MTTLIGLLVDIFAQVIVIFYPPLLVFWLIIHLNIGRWRRMGKRAYVFALLAWPAISIPLWYFRTVLFSQRWPTPWWLKALGVVSLCLAAYLGRLASRAIPLRTLIGLPELEPQHNPQPLLEEGILARIRNPVYVTHWLVIFSAAALSGFAANWIWIAIDIVVLYAMVRAEEQELRGRYGAAYSAYAGRTPRFFPKWPW